MKTPFTTSLASAMILACAARGTAVIADQSAVPSLLDRPSVRGPLLPPSVRPSDLMHKVRFDNVVYGDGCADPDAPAPNTLSFDLRDAERVYNPFFSQPNVDRVHTIEAFQVNRAGDVRRMFSASREQRTADSSYGPWPFSATFRETLVPRRRSDTVHFTLVARGRDGRALGNTQLAAPSTPAPPTVLRAVPATARWQATEVTYDDGYRSLRWEIEVDARNVWRSGTLHPASAPAWGTSNRQVRLESPEGEPHRFNISDRAERMRVIVDRWHDDVPRLLDRSLTISFPRLTDTACSHMVGPAVGVPFDALTQGRARDPTPRPDPMPMPMPMPFRGEITGIDCSCSNANASNQIVSIRACADPTASTFERRTGADFSCRLLAGSLSRAYGTTSCGLSRFNGRDGGSCSWSGSHYELE